MSESEKTGYLPHEVAASLETAWETSEVLKRIDHRPTVTRFYEQALAKREQNQPTPVTRAFRKDKQSFGKGQSRVLYEQALCRLRLVDEFSALAEERVDASIHRPELAVTETLEDMIEEVYRNPIGPVTLNSQVLVLVAISKCYRRDVT